MYSTHEAAQLKHEFWTTFGRYMSPVLSAEGEKINWINYKTGEKHIKFKMHADNKIALITIELSHPDSWLRQLYFERFEQLKVMMFECLQEEWDWQLNAIDETGKITGKIYKELKPVNILNKGDWSSLISFFKPRIIALDAFWSSANYGFESLR